MKKTAPAAVVAAAALWGVMGLFVRRLSAAGLGSLEIAQVRITVGLLLLGAYLALFHREKLRVRLRDLWCFAGTGLLSLLLFSVCYFRTIDLTSLAVAGVLLYTAPVFVMVFSIFLFRERLSARKLLALGMAVAGCALVSGVGSADALRPQGVLLGLGAGFFYALYSIFGRYAIDRGYDSFTITFYTFLFCAAGAAFLSDWGKIGAAMAVPAVALNGVLMGLITGFASYLLYTWGLAYMESSRASILASVEPAVAAVAGIVIFHERLSAQVALGVALVLGAVLVLSIHRHKAARTVNNP